MLASCVAAVYVSLMAFHFFNPAPRFCLPLPSTPHPCGHPDAEDLIRMHQIDAAVRAVSAKQASDGDEWIDKLARVHVRRMSDDLKGWYLSGVPTEVVAVDLQTSSADIQRLASLVTDLRKSREIQGWCYDLGAGSVDFDEAAFLDATHHKIIRWMDNLSRITSLM